MSQRRKGSATPKVRPSIISQLAVPQYSLTAPEKKFLLNAERGDCATVKKYSNFELTLQFIDYFILQHFNFILQSNRAIQKQTGRAQHRLSGSFESKCINYCVGKRECRFNQPVTRKRYSSQSEWIKR